VSVYYSPENLNPLYATASLFINPILRGAGLKLKTVQALAAGLPVVTTSAGKEGSGLQDGIQLLVADSAVEFAEKVRELLQDKVKSAELVAAAQRFLAERYNQERNINQFLSPIFSVSCTAERTTHSRDLCGENLMD
jgi:glycosyltransferase involved in cell wall biosynthesis